MKKLSYVVTGSMVICALLMGCQKEDTETKRQLAQVQEELTKQKELTMQMQAQALQAQNKDDQKQNELEQEDIQSDLEEKVRTQTKPEDTQSKPKATKAVATQTDEQKPAKASSTTKKITEKIVRYPATVVTSSGYGELSLRGEPSAKGLEIGTLYDGDEVRVIAETNKCEVIGKVRGCWVKVNIESGIKGYMFNGYLQRENFSQSEKRAMSNEQDDSEYGDEGLTF